MERHLFILLFFTGFIPLILSVPRKYYLIQQAKNWNNAQAYCQAEYTDLAIIESNDDIAQIQNEIQRQKFSGSAWIGLYNDINSWHWSLGNEPLGNVKLWNGGEPDNGGGHEQCVVMCVGNWCDTSCTSTYPFMCFDDTKTGNQRYIYISNSVKFSEAQSYCRTHYTDLASAINATENSIIEGLASAYTWIGLFRDGWKWTDQTNFSTISWMSGKPDNAQKNENCGYLNNGQTADAQCSDIMPFFCYSLIKKQQQIVRVKVQSIQDVNDPAVQVAILEQIQQKLKDHGMAENITVKWREQPDGKVFYKEIENNTTKKNEF